MTDREREFADAATAIKESIAMSIVDAVVRRATLSGSRPTTASRPAAVTAALKGPLYTVIVITGVITHALLLQLLPAQVTPVKPMAYGMVVAFAALAVAARFITMPSSPTAIADRSAGTANTRNS